MRTRKYKLQIPIILALIAFAVVYIVKRLVWRRREGFQAEAIPTFHFFLTSIGRPTVKRMLDSLKPEVKEGDAITLVFDGPEAPGKAGYVDAWKEGFACPVNVIIEPANRGVWGHIIRTKYQTQLQPRTTFIMHCDDDDEYIPGFLQGLRDTCRDPSVFYIAKIIIEKAEGSGEDKRRIIPSQNNDIIEGDISTQNGIIPYDMAGMSSWGLRYEGDFDYLKGLETAIGKDKIKFIPNVIYLLHK